MRDEWVEFISSRLPPPPPFSPLSLPSPLPPSSSSVQGNEGFNPPSSSLLSPIRNTFSKFGRGKEGEAGEGERKGADGRGEKEKRNWIGIWNDLGDFGAVEGNGNVVTPGGESSHGSRKDKEEVEEISSDHSPKESPG